MESRNTTWGYHGTLKTNYDLTEAETVEVFSKTVRLLADQTDQDERVARDFLDSRSGRHFADHLSFHRNFAPGRRLTTHQIIEAAGDFISGREKSWVMGSFGSFLAEYDPQDYGDLSEEDVYKNLVRKW